MSDQDHIEIEGTAYISSRNAAKTFGYTQDYVGQLARSGQVHAQRVGGMWYISKDSLAEYKRVADTFVPRPPAASVQKRSSVTVSFDGNGYISAARAAEITSYTQDYVGQLARSGAIDSRQIDGRWFIHKEDILRHKREKDEMLAAVQASSVGIKRNTEPLVPENLVKSTLSDHDSYFVYSRDLKALLPNIPGKEEKNQKSVSLRVLDEQDVVEVPEVSRKQPRALVLQQESQPPYFSGVHLQHRVPRVAHKNLQNTVVLATVVLFLGFGLASLNVRSVYAVMRTPVVRGAAQLAAAAGYVGASLETVFTKDIEYRR